MNPSNAHKALSVARDSQHRHDAIVSPEKAAAKHDGVLAAAVAWRHLHNDLNHPFTRPSLLDVGGEGWYLEPHRAMFATMDTLNLPDHDMHDLIPYMQVDVVLAMHVLEHSPFPMLALANIREAMADNAVLYVAVPQPVEPFLSMSSHWTVMPAGSWTKVIEASGFVVTDVSDGVFGNYEGAIEHRITAVTQ